MQCKIVLSKENNRDVIMKALLYNVWNFLHLSKENQSNVEYITTSIKIQPSLIKYIDKNHPRYKEFCLIAVKRDGTVLRKLSYEMQYCPEIIKVALKEDYRCWPMIPRCYRNTEEIWNIRDKDPEWREYCNYILNLHLKPYLKKPIMSDQAYETLKRLSKSWEKNKRNNNYKLMMQWIDAEYERKHPGKEHNYEYIYELKCEHSGNEYGPVKIYGDLLNLHEETMPGEDIDNLSMETLFYTPSDLKIERIMSGKYTITDLVKLLQYETNREVILAALSYKSFNYLDIRTKEQVKPEYCKFMIDNYLPRKNPVKKNEPDYDKRCIEYVKDLLYTERRERSGSDIYLMAQGYSPKNDY